MKNCLNLIILFLSLSNLAVSQISLGQERRYVYNNTKDTIFFTNFKPRFSALGFDPKVSLCGDIKIVDSIQVDGIGRKELVFYFNCTFSNSQHGGTFDIDESVEIGKYEIWNLDTKSAIFEVIDFKRTNFNRFISGQPKANGNTCYKSDVTFDDSGTITVKNVKTDCSVENEKKVKSRGKRKKDKRTTTDIEGKKLEIVYKFIDGKYTRIEG